MGYRGGRFIVRKRKKIKLRSGILRYLHFDLLRIFLKGIKHLVKWRFLLLKYAMKDTYKKNPQYYSDSENGIFYKRHTSPVRNAITCVRCIFKFDESCSELVLEYPNTSHFVIWIWNLGIHYFLFAPSGSCKLILRSFLIVY